MPKRPKSWIDSLKRRTATLSAAETEALRDLCGTGAVMGRGALALRIALLQADLARAPVVTLPSPPPPPEPEPVITELPAPPEPPPAPKPVKAKKKVSFGAISLDDAASLLSAFGGAPAATDDSPPPDGPTPNS